MGFLCRHQVHHPRCKNLSNSSIMYNKEIKRAQRPSSNNQTLVRANETKKKYRLRFLHRGKPYQFCSRLLQKRNTQTLTRETKQLHPNALAVAIHLLMTGKNTSEKKKKTSLWNAPQYMHLPMRSSGSRLDSHFSKGTSVVPFLEEFSRNACYFSPYKYRVSVDNLKTAIG